VEQVEADKVQMLVNLVATQAEMVPLVLFMYYDSKEIK
jgi:hypothetical protein